MCPRSWSRAFDCFVPTNASVERRLKEEIERLERELERVQLAKAEERRSKDDARRRESEWESKWECKVCMENDVESVFLPCGHAMACSSCSGRLRDCPVCRSPVTGVTQIFRNV